MPDYPQLEWITSNPDYSDYRPAIDEAGYAAVFERAPYPNPDKTPAVLYRSKDVQDTPTTPETFLPDGPTAQNRPDWCWHTDTIAFNGTPASAGGGIVWTVDGDGQSGLTELDGTAGFFYPAWSKHGHHLAVLDSDDSESPTPRTAQIDPEGAIQIGNLNGDDADGTPLYGGMPAVNPNDDTTVAFAGQPVIDGWAAPENPTPDKYSQDYNYIFLNSESDGTYSSAPMEPGADITTYTAAYQGRAPNWSPDGRYVVFESDRGGDGYAIYLFDTQSDDPAVQLTDSSYGAQHAKFFHDGQKLILVASQNGDGGRPFGIAWIDISDYVSS